MDRGKEAMDTTTGALRWKTAREWACAFAGLLVVAFVATEACAAAGSQHTFAAPGDAASALVQAIKSRDRTATVVVLGNAGEWMSSGDATADRAAAERFVAAYEAKHAIARDGDKATLTIGEDGFPFAFPIIKNGDRWRFDTAAGSR